METPQQNEEPTVFVIPRELLEATLNFLGTQPYTRVAALIEDLARLRPLQLEATTEEEKVT